MFDLESKKLSKVLGIPKELKIQKPLFLGPKGDSIVFVGIEGEFPSGTVYCVNKDSGIYIVENYRFKDTDADKNKKDKTENCDKKEEEEEKNDSVEISTDPIAYGPISSPSGNLICYQFTAVYNESHFFNTGLKVYNRETKEITELITDSEEDGELSLYISTGDTYACYWDKNEKNVTFANVEKARTIINRVNIVTGERTKLSLRVNFETDSITVLEFCPKTGDALVTVNNFYHCLNLGYLKGVQNSLNTGEPVTIIVEENQKNRPFVEGDIFEEKLESGDVEGYIWGLKNEDTNRSERPCLVTLHGGPHSCSRVGYSHFLNALFKRGFQILTVNFSGSITYGKNFNDRLGGNICDLDSREVMEIIEKLQVEDKLTKKDLHFSGGSYSGQQGVHYLQAFPHTFKSITVRNPVVNLIYKIFATDIPEWTTREGLGDTSKFDISKDLSDEQLIKLKKHSPGLQKFDSSSKTRVLLILGMSDRRVNPRGGLFLYKKLKKIGIDIKCKVYEGEGHAISKIDNVFENTMAYFKVIFG